MKRIFHIGIFCLAFFSGCVKEAAWENGHPVPVLLVVEGTLTDERKPHAVRLSLPMGNLNEIPVPVLNAQVILSNEDSVWYLEEDSLLPGYYMTKPYFIAQQGKTYTLQIFYGNEVFSAQAAMEPGALFSALTYRRNESNDLYHIDFVASAFSQESPAMWEVLVDWSGVPGYEQQDPSSCRARMLFYTLPTLDVSQIFAPSVEEISFPAGTVITERRYSLTAAHAEFIRELLLSTSWQGSLFPSANANVMGNISPGAIGFFGVCAVTEVSLVVTP